MVSIIPLSATSLKNPPGSQPCTSHSNEAIRCVSLFHSFSVLITDSAYMSPITPHRVTAALRRPAASVHSLPLHSFRVHTCRISARRPRAR
ncbi:hypothetical protein B0H17DRAFT_992862 [Mycena rosella]|uniref:Uncharacterized protein n=1 Tax=Mycena rosella TaxID=1033263 RepID=A0AAD7G548_MYCRO|nr:hypothetical protein B0H17DRAFT_992862 [Mycena rosella]